MKAFLLFFGFLSCGTAQQVLEKNEPGRRIVGGQPANIHQFPYQLSLERGGEHICGAAILNTAHAITSAHCVSGQSTRRFRLRAGTSTKGSGGSLHEALRIVRPQLYDTDTKDYDVAIIKVLQAFVYSSTVQPIPILDTTPGDGELVTVSGWGSLSEGGSFPTQLYAVTMPIVSRQTCAAAYIQQGLTITDRMVCAGREGLDSCKGDSGGPLIIGDMLVGVVSMGMGCARAGYPGVYTKLANPFLKLWIEQNIHVE